MKKVTVPNFVRAFLLSVSVNGWGSTMEDLAAISNPAAPSGKSERPVVTQVHAKSDGEGLRI